MAAALESKFVTVEGVRLHYQELGSGYPLICIHGAGPGASAESNFKLNAGPFAEKFRVILYDMPQYGKSDKIVLKEPRLKYNARLLNGFMAALGIDKAHIVGNSMGGQVGDEARPRLSRAPQPRRHHRQHADAADLRALPGRGNQDDRRATTRAPARAARSCASCCRRSSTIRRSSPRRPSRSATRRASIPRAVELFGKRQGEIPREDLGPRTAASSRPSCSRSGAWTTASARSMSGCGSPGSCRTRRCTSSRDAAIGRRSSTRRRSTAWCSIS